MYFQATYPSDAVSVTLVLGKQEWRRFDNCPVELQGAVIAVRLSSTVKEELAMNDVPTTYSQTVLQWIHSRTCGYHAFVAHRITEIVESSSPSDWRHVPREINPADDTSRGIPAASLT